MDCCKQIIELFVDGIYLDNKITKQWKYIIHEDWVRDWVKSNHPNYKLGDVIMGFKYELGDYLGWHRDNTYSQAYDKTGGVVLNNDYNGGLFEFEDGSILNQTPGKSFEMSRSIKHRVTKITSGVRYSLHYGLIEKEIKQTQLI